MNSQESTIRNGTAILSEIVPTVTRFFYSIEKNEGMSELPDAPYEVTPSEPITARRRIFYRKIPIRQQENHGNVSGGLRCDSRHLTE